MQLCSIRRISLALHITLFIVFALSGCAPPPAAPDPVIVIDENNGDVGHSPDVDDISPSNNTPSANNDPDGPEPLPPEPDIDEDCEHPMLQSASQPCCLIHGVDACGERLFCAAFDGRSQAICYTEYTREDGEQCFEDKHCESRRCNQDMRRCKAAPAAQCTPQVGCAITTTGTNYICVQNICQELDGEIGSPCIGDGDCLSGSCCNEVCIDTQADQDHCGQCNNACATTCAEGQCLTITQIACGTSNTVAALSDGSALHWGRTLTGWSSHSTGGSSTWATRSTPRFVKDMNDAVQTAASEDFACVRLGTGWVQCWGRNNNGTLGTVSGHSAISPENVHGISNAAHISTNRRHACAVLDNGSLWCWGNIWTGDYFDTNTPVEIENIANAKQVAAGSNFTCVLLNNSTVQCWGNNLHGQIAMDPEVSSFSYQFVSVPGISTATQISAGEHFSCVLLNNGTVQCWGSNEHGQLGNGSNQLDFSHTPVAVSGLSNVIQVSAGAQHACALLDSGAIQCWGYNDMGQLGNGSTSTATTPVSVTGINTATYIGTGAQHSCAVLQDGSAKCWGRNNNGQLGDSSTANSVTPQPVDF